MSSNQQESPASFEQKLAELEGLVEQLESGELELAESLERFKTGIELSRQCREQLDQARHTVDEVMADATEEPAGRSESDETSD